MSVRNSYDALQMDEPTDVMSCSQRLISSDIATRSNCVCETRSGFCCTNHALFRDLPKPAMPGIAAILERLFLKQMNSSIMDDHPRLSTRNPPRRLSVPGRVSMATNGTITSQSTLRMSTAPSTQRRWKQVGWINR